MCVSCLAGVFYVASQVRQPSERPDLLLLGGSRLGLRFLVPFLFSLTRVARCVVRARADPKERLHKKRLHMENKKAELEAALVDAAERGEEAMVRKYLDEGVNVDATDPHSCSDWDGRPTHQGALYKAAKRGVDPGGTRVAVVKLLIERKANLNLQEREFGETPLMGAAEQGQVEMVKLLLAAGADTGVKNNHNKTALENIVTQMEMAAFSQQMGAELGAWNSAPVKDKKACVALLKKWEGLSPAKREKKAAEWSAPKKSSICVIA